jgi:cell division protein FtsI/penicillin-binding protein 2
MNLLFLTFPALVFVAIPWLAIRNPDRIRMAFVCLMVAVLSAASALLLLRMVDSTGRWIDHAQIAWVGVAPAEGNSLTLGSPSAGAVPAWPGDHLSPTVKFTVAPNGQMNLESSGGGGFVLDSNENVLYGTSLDHDQVVSDRDGDSYTLSVKKRGWPMKKWRIDVFRNGQSLLMNGEGELNASETSVVNLAGELDRTLRRMRAQSDPEAGPLNSWAAQVQLLLTNSNHAYFAVAGKPGSGIQPQSSQVPAGAVIAIRWSRLRLDVRIETVDGTPRLVFLPPFRESSPLPPEDAPAPVPTKLEIEATPAPGHKAFLLPIGALPAPHAEALLVDGKFQNKSGNPAPDVAGIPGVTSSFDAVIANYHFYLDTIHDVPAAWSAGAGLPLFLPLLVVWLGYMCCLLEIFFLYNDTIEPRTLIALLGISLVAWVVLCARVGLAFRYAANPGTVDALAVGGLTLSLGALAFLPSFILVLAFLCAVTRQEASDLGLRRLLPAANLLVFLIIPALVWHMWPILHLSQTPGRVEGVLSSFHAAYTAEKPCGLFLFLWLIGCVWLWRKARRGSRQSLEDRLVNLEETLTVMWVKHWQRRDIAIVVGAILVVFALAIGTRLFPSLNGPGKEAFAPLCQLLGLAILLVPGRGQLHSADRVGRWKKSLIGCILILLPCLLLPALGFGDWGGVVGGLALFLPFLFVVLLGNHRALAKWFAAAVIVLCVSGILLFFFPGWAIRWPRVYTRITIAEHTSKWAEDQWLTQRAYNSNGDSVAQQFAFGDEHRWANLRMIRIGAYTGVGFGNSSPQKAGIALNTVQADSTYAFYIASEHGAWGGVFLLLLASLPLALVAWRHWRASSASWLTELLYIIAGAFFLETLAQVLMNSMQMIPFTGRNLPLLSVSSLSDVLRWSVLFSCAVLIMVADRDPQDGASARSWQWPARIVAAVVCIVCVSPILILIQGRLADRTLENRMPGQEIAVGAVPPVYDRDAEVRGQVEQIRNELAFDPATDRIVFTSPEQQDRNRDTQLQQEIQRFNGLPDSLKIVFPGGNSLRSQGDIKKFVADITSLTTVDGYLTLMDNWKKEENPAQAAALPPLFRVEERLPVADVDQSPESGKPSFEIQANPAYDAAIDLDTRLNPDGLKTIAWRNGSGDSWLLQGPGVQVTITTGSGAGTGANALRSKVVLTPMKGVNNRIDRFSASVQQATGKLKVVLDCPNESNWKIPFLPKRVPPQTELIDFDASGSGITITPADLKLAYQPAGSAGFKDFNGKITLNNGARFRPRQSVCKLPTAPIFTLTHSSAGALVGAAWVNGEWEAAYDASARLTWLQQLARFSQSQHEKQLGFDRVTLEPRLQAAAQASVDQHGRDLQKKLLAAAIALCADVNCGSTAAEDGARIPWQLALKRTEARRLFLPPRAAVSIMNLNGEVLALAGWPRSSTTGEWETEKDADGKTEIDVHPPAQWLATEAPAAVRNRYLGDRNFDLLVAGSSTKPIWAAASLSVNPRLVHLDVRGVKADHTLFGIDIPGATWNGTDTGKRWIDFTHYLSNSNNNYQVRLNFLGLAPPNPGPNVVQVERNSDGSEYHTSSQLETFATQPWERAPELAAYGFSHKTPQTLQGLADSQLAQAMQAHFPVNIVETNRPRRSYDISFWSGNELDNLVDTKGVEERWGPLSSISPAATNFEFDATSPDPRHLPEFASPRAFISVLLGGSTNSWSNLDLPSSIYTAMSGRPIVPHIGILPRTESTRDPLPRDVSDPIRAGLEEMIRSGTGAPFLSDKFGGAHALSRSLGPEYNFYAKTGTLETLEETRESSDLALARIVLIIVPKGTDKSRARKGLILSFVSEYGGMSNSESNSAVEWISDFVLENRDLLKDAMK